MTILTEEKTKGKIRIRLEGHAMYAREKDIVCAAASILAHTLLENFPQSEKTYDPEAAVIAIDIQDTQENRIRYEAIRKGFSLLEKQYPKNFKSRGEIQTEV